MEAYEVGTNIDYINYKKRNQEREWSIIVVTMDLVTYFISLGDTVEAANLKVSLISNDVATYLYLYVLGNTQPLKDAINNSQLECMTTETKEFILGKI